MLHPEKRPKSWVTPPGKENEKEKGEISQKEMRGREVEVKVGRGEERSQRGIDFLLHIPEQRQIE